MTNYMGKNRLRKIVLQFLSDRPDVIKELRSLTKEYGSDNIFIYSHSHGNEWMKIYHCGGRIELYVCGKQIKTVTINIWKDKTDSSGTEGEEHYDRIVTYYDENFAPIPGAAWLSGKVAGITARATGYHPFADESSVPERSKYVCYGIARQATYPKQR